MASPLLQQKTHRVSALLKDSSPCAHAVAVPEREDDAPVPAVDEATF